MCPRRRADNGRLTAFLVVTAVGHNMDSPELFPPKPPRMRKIFGALAANLYDRVRLRRIRAA
jgi:hypothetical protein